MGIFRPLSDTLAFSTTGFERMRVTSGGSVGIGITAPPEVRVDREEVHQARMEFVDVETDELANTR